MPNGGKPPWRFGVIAGVVVLVDLLTKLLVQASFAHGQARQVAGEWFQLRLVYNPGAAFGLSLGAYSRWIFLAIALVAVVLLWRMARNTPATDRFRLVALGLVAGGAAGNLIDRIRSPIGVVDFLDLGLGALRWPTFNVADMGVSCGAIALAISLWLEDARTTAASHATPAS